jgi:hypothetical protein
MTNEPEFHPDDLAEIAEALDKIAGETVAGEECETTEQMVRSLGRELRGLDESHGHAAVVLFQTGETRGDLDQLGAAVVNHGGNPYELMSDPQTLRHFARPETVALGVYTYGTATNPETGESQSVRSLVIALADGLHAYADMENGDTVYMGPAELLDQEPTKLATAVVIAWTMALMMRGDK